MHGRVRPCATSPASRESLTLLLASMAALLPMSTFTTSSYPKREAWMRGVHPLCSRAASQPEQPSAEGRRRRRRCTSHTRRAHESRPPPPIIAAPVCIDCAAHHFRSQVPPNHAREQQHARPERLDQHSGRLCPPPHTRTHAQRQTDTHTHTDVHAFTRTRTHAHTHSAVTAFHAAESNPWLSGDNCPLD